MMSCDCGAETIGARAPGGRVIALDTEHVFVLPGEMWPRGLFILGIEAVDDGATVPVATPALETVDGQPRNVRQGPYRREHFCA